MKRLAVAILALASGCAENGILELELDLPAAADACGATEAALEARIPQEGSCFFDQEWLDGDAAVLALGAHHEVSVVAAGADVARPLCLRVRACRGPCPPPEITIGVRAEIELERAFYLGRYTHAALGTIDLCANTRTSIQPCEVTCDDPAPACDPSGPHPCE